MKANLCLDLSPTSASAFITAPLMIIADPASGTDVRQRRYSVLDLGLFF